jgi:hypothetical protein
VVELAERIAHIQETHFGREFQVISKPDPENLAYTAVKLTAQTDSALLGSIDFDSELIEPFYAAWQAFGRVLCDPDLGYVFKMSPGDCQVFDNHRVLHARAAFDPNTSARHLQYEAAKLLTFKAAWKDDQGTLSDADAARCPSGRRGGRRIHPRDFPPECQRWSKSDAVRSDRIVFSDAGERRRG